MLIRKEKKKTGVSPRTSSNHVGTLVSRETGEKQRANVQNRNEEGKKR
jgi:hypothetical protein